MRESSVVSGRFVVLMLSGALLATVGWSADEPTSPAPQSAWPVVGPECGPCATFFADGASCPAEDPAEPLSQSLPLWLQGTTNLVFEGGGVKGTAYAGALAVLEEAGLLGDIRRVAGTSVGSITALLVALGYDGDEAREIALTLDYGSFRDGGGETRGLERLHEHLGFHPGDNAACVIRCLVARKTGDPDTTFSRLHEMAADPSSGFRDLVVFATHLEGHRSVRFSADDPATRDVPLAVAVRSSMSIPLFFVPVHWNDALLVDGGLLRNYPIDAFDPFGGRDSGTLGLHLGGEPDATSIAGLEEMVVQVLHTVLAGQRERLCEDPEDVARTLFIDSLGVKTSDFALTDAKKCALVASGEKAARHALSAPAPPAGCPDFVHRSPALSAQ